MRSAASKYDSFLEHLFYVSKFHLVVKICNGIRMKVFFGILGYLNT